MFDFVQIAAKGSRPKKGATRRTPPPQAKRKTPWWLWLIVPAILLAFVYGLTQLSHVRSKTTTAPVKPTQPKPAVTKTTKAEAAKVEPKKAEPKKKESFDFYQILQDSEVDTSHVDAYQYEPRGEQDFFYMLQAASFRDPKDADSLRAKLIMAGMVDTNVRQTISTKDGKPWYRVIIGPFNDRSKMNHIEDKLVDMRIESFSYKVKKELPSK